MSCSAGDGSLFVIVVHRALMVVHATSVIQTTVPPGDDAGRRSDRHQVF